MPAGQEAKLEFAADATALSPSAEYQLAALIAPLRRREDLRLQILAYASGDNLSPSRARRLSLSRALAVRSYLIDNGIDSRRIDVRALGDKALGEPRNRVDVKIVGR